MQVGTWEGDDFLYNFYTQPATPDTHINDLASFHSTKTRAMKQEAHFCTMTEKMKHVLEAFIAHPKYKFTDMWAY